MSQPAHTASVVEPPARPAAPPWKVLIVDDEDEVHEVTRLVLGEFVFEGRRLEFLQAYSAEQARALLDEHPDVAVVLLDVVMESEQAGLELVHFIRRELDNHDVRIVLRTGQPGQAPEREVVANYDINDYKEKTELTSERLFTTIYATLRAYRDVVTIKANKQGLERVIEGSAGIFASQTSEEFAAAVLRQLEVLLGRDCDAVYGHVHSAGARASVPRIVDGIGAYADTFGRTMGEVLPDSLRRVVETAWRDGRRRVAQDHFVLPFSDSHDAERLLFAGRMHNHREVDRKLLEVFCANVEVAFENLHLSRELTDSQAELLCLLAGAAETRSMETANHVRRVGELAGLLAEGLGLPEHDVEMMKRAAPLHDIGKIGIPDAILNKPGAHTEEEQRIMREHARIGADMLSVSSRPLFRLAASIAHDHHENWDGSGYPRGLSGRDISLGGRIVALADVFDALGSDRCYKAAWDADEVRDYIRQRRGTKFDPELVDLLFRRWGEVLKVRERLPD